MALVTACSSGLHITTKDLSMDNTITKNMAKKILVKELVIQKVLNICII